MASTAGRDIVKSEIRGSLLAVIPRKEGEPWGISHVRKPVKLTHSETRRKER